MNTNTHAAVALSEPLYGEAAVQLRDQLAEDTRQRADAHATSEPTRGPRETTETGVDFAAYIAAIPAAVDEAMRKALPDHYNPETAATISARMISLLTGTACPIYQDCTATEPGHYDHFSGDIKVIDATDGGTILDAGMVALSAAGPGDDSKEPPHALVYVRNAEFTDADAVHAKTAELRRFLDGVDAMADRVFADHAAHVAQAGGGK